MLKLLSLINSVRSTPLVPSTYLNKMAQQRCISTKEWSHYDFYQKYQWSMIAEGYTYAGENLARGQKTPLETFKQLEASPTHHANNINPKYTKVGIATCNSKVGKLTVVLFGGKA